MAITTLARTKLRLGITLTSQDALLTMLLEQAEAFVARTVSCSLDSPPVQATEFYDGNNRQELPLRRWPVTAVASVYVHSAGAAGQDADPFPADTLLDPETQYYLDLQPGGTVSRSGLLMRRGSAWPGRSVSTGYLTPSVVKGQGNLKVTYTAGWTTIPADLELVVQRLVAIELAQQFTGRAVQSESFEHGDYSYALAAAADAKESAGSTASILASYSRPWF